MLRRRPSVAKFDIDVRRRCVAESIDRCEYLTGGQIKFDTNLVEVGGVVSAV
jgi:hypothetical protein